MDYSNLQNSVVLITSRDSSVNRFGTGFVVNQQGKYAYVLTCAHVIKDVGGIEKVMVDHLVATVVATGESDNIDLAVLQVNHLSEKVPLVLQVLNGKHLPFFTIGFQIFGSHYLIRQLNGSLGESVGLESRHRRQRLQAWDLKIIDENSLQPGYSGSPVMNKATQTVLGVVSHRQGEGKKGLAISVEALGMIWPGMPANLLSEATPSIPSISDEVTRKRTKAAHIFVVYARSDGEALARQLHSDFTLRQIPSWIDLENITPGTDWDMAINQALQATKAVIVVLTPGLYLSLQAKSEWADALNRHLPVIPLLMTDCQVPRVLKVLQYIDFREDYAAGFSKLLQRIDALDRDHFKYLNQTLAAFQVISQEAPIPQRFQVKIDNLQSTIATWKNRIDMQRHRVTSGLEEQRQEITEQRSHREHQNRQRIVGRAPLDVKGYFKDRQQEQLEIGQLLAESSTRVVTVVGRGGIGKTALASKILNDLEHSQWPHTEERIPVDGLVYLSTRTSGISWERLFFDCARMLGGKEEKILHTLWTNLQTTTQAKAHRLLEALQDGVYVILLDNLEDLLNDDGQFIDDELQLFFDMSLLGSHGTRLLITSRVPLRFRREVMRFDQQVPLLEGLPIPDGITLLRELDPNGIYGIREASEDQLAQVVEFVHGVPRALEVVVSILANDPFATLDEVVEGFYRYEDVVQELIEEGYRRLDHEAQRVMEALSVFGVPVPPLAIDYLLEPFFPGLNIPTILRRLAQTHMISVDRRTKTVTMHPIDRDYSYRQLPDQEKQTGYTRRSLESRAADYYVHHRTTPESWQIITDLDPQMKEFEHRVKAGEFTIAANLIDSINTPLLLWGHPRLIITLRQQLLNKIEECSVDSNNRGKIAMAYHHIGEHKKAIAYLKEALHILSKMKDRYHKGIWLGNLGKVYIYLPQIELAMECLQQAATISHEFADLQNEGIWLGHLGICYSILADRVQSIGYYEKALVISQKTNDQSSEGYWMLKLGVEYRRLGLYEKSISYIEQAISISRKYKNIYTELEGLNNLGLNYHYQGRFKEALKIHHNALITAQEVGFKKEEVGHLGSLGSNYFYIGEYDRAIDFHQKGLSVARDREVRLEQGHRLSALGRIYLNLREYTEAERFLIESLEIFTEVNNTTEQQKREAELAQVYLHTKQFDKALKLSTSAYGHNVKNSEYHITLVVHAIITACSDQKDKAISLFEETLRYIDELLTQTSGDYRMPYIRGLALIGFALLSPINKQLSLLSKSLNAYQSAVQNCDAVGVIAEASLLLNSLKPLDDKKLLCSIESILHGS